MSWVNTKVKLFTFDLYHLRVDGFLQIWTSRLSAEVKLYKAQENKVWQKVKASGMTGRMHSYHSIIWSDITCTRSGLLQESVPVGGGGGGGHSEPPAPPPPPAPAPPPPPGLTNMESMSGGASVLGPYSSSSSVLLHLDMEELQETDLNKNIFTSYFTKL